jgi:hypothetical protein
MSNESEQKGINVPQHKRLAQGEKLTGQSMQGKGGNSQPAKRTGGLSGAKKTNA